MVAGGKGSGGCGVRVFNPGALQTKYVLVASNHQPSPFYIYLFYLFAFESHTWWCSNGTASFVLQITTKQCSENKVVWGIKYYLLYAKKELQPFLYSSHLPLNL